MRYISEISISKRKVSVRTKTKPIRECTISWRVLVELDRLPDVPATNIIYDTNFTILDFFPFDHGDARFLDEPWDVKDFPKKDRRCDTLREDVRRSEATDDWDALSDFSQIKEVHVSHYIVVCV